VRTAFRSAVAIYTLSETDFDLVRVPVNLGKSFVHLRLLAVDSGVKTLLDRIDSCHNQVDLYPLPEGVSMLREWR
jgi:hypothetical protein